MANDNTNETFDLICRIALKAKQRCDEPIPEIVEVALDEILGLARYKGIAGNSIPEGRRKLLGLSDE